MERLQRLLEQQGIELILATSDGRCTFLLNGRRYTYWIDGYTLQNEIKPLGKNQTAMWKAFNTKVKTKSPTYIPPGASTWADNPDYK